MKTVLIHGFYDPDTPDSFFFFGESDNHSEGIPKKRGRKPKTPRIYPHPNSVPAEELIDLLNGIAGGCEIEWKKSTRAALFPSESTKPVPSYLSSMRAFGVHKEPKHLLPWEYNTISCDLSSLATLYTHLFELFSSGVRVGDSLRYWLFAIGFSIELVAHECFIPGFSGTGADKRVIWKLFNSDDDQKRSESLAGSMPNVCKSCANGYTKNSGPGHKFASHEIQERFVSDMTSRLIADAFSEMPVPFKITKKTRKSEAEELDFFLKLTGSDTAFSKEEPSHFSDKFTAKMDNWLLGGSAEISTGEFKTCFRLEEPDENSENKKWQITFHIQGRDDPSLLIPAEEIWGEKTKQHAYLMNRFDHPEEEFLADMGRAVRIYPPLSEGLKTACPASLEIEQEKVYQFLSEAAPVLQQSGFIVLLPPWWNEKKVRPVLKIDLKPSETKESLGYFSFENLLEFDYTIAIGGETFSPEEFMQLADLKRSLVNVKGKWVAFDSEEIRRTLRAFEKKYSGGSIETADLLKLETSRLYEKDFEIEISSPGGLVGEMLANIRGEKKAKPVTIPKSFNGKLRPYQRRGVSWLSFLTQHGMGACLADDMGLGKTPQFIAYLLSEMKYSKIPATPVLVICPMSIIGNWKREFARFAPEVSVYVHHGTDRSTGEQFSEMVAGHDVIITTYNLSHRDLDSISQVSWACILLDEAQNIKNHLTKQSLAIRKIKAARRIALTGTPVENRLTELWSIMDFLNRGYLGSNNRFYKEFAVPVERYHDSEKALQLRTMVGPFVMRRLKSDRSIIKDLPDKIEQKVFVTLTKEQATLYQATVDEMLRAVEESEGIQRRGIILSTLTKLKQICNHPVLLTADGSVDPRRSGKLVRLFEMMDEVIENGDRAIVFTQYATFAVQLQALLQDRFSEEVLLLHGKTRRKKRDEIVELFQSENGPRIFVISLKAGGVGLNLTSASHVFHVDRWWNPAVEDQATDRAYRIGQTRNVQVHLMISAGTLEEQIDIMLEEKRKLAEQIVGSGEEWFTGLSTDKLRELVSLSDDAFGEY